MSGLETAIRNALARSERANAEVRARIYQSARNALEAGLRKQEINDPETIATQRHRLEATIHEIEAEERAQLTAAPAQDVHVEPVIEARPEPVLGAERGGASGAEQRHDGWGCGREPLCRPHPAG